VDEAHPATPLPITSLSISYGDGTYANTYPEQATVVVSQGTSSTATVTPDKQKEAEGGYPLSIATDGTTEEVYVALLPESKATIYSFSLESGTNTYTGTATAHLIAGEFVVAELKLND
jgi:hypothetical protein